jgi:hypothetical protein
MLTIENLWQDHGQLREQLDELEAALRLGPEGSALVRRRCAKLLALLQSHHQREDCLAGGCRKAMTDTDRDLLASSHSGGLADLQGIYQVLRAPGSNWPWMQDVLGEWIRQMRFHLVREEQEIFPDLSRATCSPALAGVP